MKNYVWFALWAPRNTPQPIIDKLYSQVKEALANPSVKDRIVADAGAPTDMPLAEIEPFVKAEIVKWAEVVKRSGISVQQVPASAVLALHTSIETHDRWLL